MSIRKLVNLIKKTFDNEESGRLDFKTILKLEARFVYLLKHTDQKKMDQTELNLLSRLIAHHLFASCGNTDDDNLIYLLDVIGWNCELLFQHAEDWVTSEEYAGYDTIKIHELSIRNKRNITGYNCQNSIYGLMMAIRVGQTRSREIIEKFIIDHNIKLIKGSHYEDDAMIRGVIEYLKEKQYNLLE